MFQVDRKQQAVVLIVAAVLVFTAGYRVSKWSGAENDAGPGQSVVQSNPEEGLREISVHVSGAVEKPGVYKFTGDERVLDAVEKAVPLQQADIQSLNLAAVLRDGQKITVPLKAEAPDGGTAGEAGQPAKTVQKVSAGKININRANAAELESLPGVGPALAQRIINYRENSGLFMAEEDVKNVPGIGDKLYEQIKDYIEVN